MEFKICKQESDKDEDFVKLRQLGADGVNSASRLKNDDVHVEAGDFVHKNCRKKYIKRKSSETFEQGPTSSTRSSKSSFEFRSKCFLCGNGVTKKERENNEVVNVAC